MASESSSPTYHNSVATDARASFSSCFLGNIHCCRQTSRKRFRQLLDGDLLTRASPSATNWAFTVSSESSIIKAAAILLA
jgi:hypothetical protein